MEARADEIGVRVSELADAGNPPAGTAQNGLSFAATAAGVLALLLSAGAIAMSATGIYPAGRLLVVAGVTAAAFLFLQRMAARIEKARAHAPTVKDLMESAGASMVAIGLDGRVIYVNPAAERLLGYHAIQLKAEWGTTEILAPGEGSRLVSEMQKLCGVDKPMESTAEGRMAAYLDCVRALPPSLVPSFDAQLRHRRGQMIPVTLHITALRDVTGRFCGLMAVAMEQIPARKPERDRLESQDPYRDLFEHSSEMIATLNSRGKFLYANPAWKRCFGMENQALMELETFEQLLNVESRGEAAALFRRVLDGEVVERAGLHHYTQDGRALELELSLSQLHHSGNPHTVRCLLRDVTQQKRREQRLALQLVVSQIVGENTATEVAAMRVLEALCVSQGWDVALQWQVNPKQNQLEFLTAWGAPGKRAEKLIQESMGLTLPSGGDLPGRAWKEGRAVWLADLSAAPASPRIQTALRQEMASGWAVPVRVGSQVLAVLEFYCRVKLREDREAMAAVETVAGSLGQMLARTQEQGKAAELSRQQQILLDSVTDGICGVDRMGMVSFANPAAARLLGLPVAKLTGKRVHELLHGAAVNGQSCGEECALRRAAENRMAATGEDTVFRADASAFPAEYVLTPILDQGRFSGSVLSFRDISQRSALDRMKDEFISTVSHELRTPLTSIRGALGLLTSGILGEMNEKAANLLRIALTNSDRLVRLINDILDLERIQSGREPLAFRPVQLAEIVSQAIEGMQPVADAGGVHLIHDTVQAEVEADPDRLLQVLTNLLSNAVKFSPANSTVSVMLKPDSKGITLSVIDHGRGIPADKLEAIFGRFQQVDASDSRQKGGSGLGLAICRTIVLQHSGRIWAERNLVRGSTFRVFLPYHPEPFEAAGGAKDGASAEAAKG